MSVKCNINLLEEKLRSWKKVREKNRTLGKVGKMKDISDTKENI